MTTATGDTLAITYGGGNTIQVDSGGELKAAGTIFNLDQVTLIGRQHLDQHPPDRRLVQRQPRGSVVQHDPFRALRRRAVLGRQRELQGHRRHRRPHVQRGNAEPQQDRHRLVLDVFPAGFTIGAGASLSVGPNVNVLISTYQTITDGGSLSFAAGDTVNFNGAAAIEVKSGGTMTTATGDTLAIAYGGGNTIQVDSGGELKAAGTIFNLDQVTLMPAAS